MTEKHSNFESQNGILALSSEIAMNRLSKSQIAGALELRFTVLELPSLRQDLFQLSLAPWSRQRV